MSNIFLFRHGECFGADSEYEKLSPFGIMQAKKAGIFVSEKLNDCYIDLKKKKKGFGKLEGLLKVHSGRPRTLNFLEIMFETVEKNYKGSLGFYGDIIDIVSPEIYSSNSSKKIHQIINQCSPFAGIQLIIGHNPGIARVVKDYTENEFDFIGNKIFLEATHEGEGYYIDTPEKIIHSTNQ